MIHSGAGIGRSGMMVGLLLMQKYGLTAREAIAWMRLTRPCAVVGT